MSRLHGFHWINRILPPCNYCHHPWYVGHKSYHKALLTMFSCDGISDHAIWNEVFHYWDSKLSWELKKAFQCSKPWPNPNSRSALKAHHAYITCMIFEGQASIVLAEMWQLESWIRGWNSKSGLNTPLTFYVKTMILKRVGGYNFIPSVRSRNSVCNWKGFFW